MKGWSYLDPHGNVCGLTPEWTPEEHVAYWAQENPQTIFWKDDE